MSERKAKIYKIGIKTLIVNEVEAPDAASAIDYIQEKIEPSAPVEVFLIEELSGK